MRVTRQRVCHEKRKRKRMRTNTNTQSETITNQNNSSNTLICLATVRRIRLDTFALRASVCTSLINETIRMFAAVRHGRLSLGARLTFEPFKSNLIREVCSVGVQWRYSLSHARTCLISMMVSSYLSPRASARSIIHSVSLLFASVDSEKINHISVDANRN